MGTPAVQAASGLWPDSGIEARSDFLDTLIVFAVTLAAYSMLRVRATPFDYDMRIAAAMLRGYLDLGPNSGIHEVARYGNHFYVIYPPLGAILMMPLVAIAELCGSFINQTTIATIVGALDAALAWRMLRRIAGRRAAGWLTLAFAGGTIVLYEATLGASWGFSSVLSCAPTLIALELILRRAGDSATYDPLWIGLAAGAGFLARYDLVIVIPVYGAMLYFRNRNYRSEAPPLWLYAAGLMPALAIYLGLNFSRYGVPWDRGLAIWYATDPMGAASNPGVGPFAPRYLWYNLYTAFFMAPAFQRSFPWIRPMATGQALWFTTPAFILALRAPLSDIRVRWLWLAAILSMSGAMLVWWNGAEQFGARYWIQCYPFLFALLAFSMPLNLMESRRERWLEGADYALIAISVFLTVSGTITIRYLGWV